MDAVVGVLNMGNVEFGLVNDDTPRPSADSRENITNVARLMNIDLEQLVNALTTKRQTIGKEVLTSPLTID